MHVVGKVTFSAWQRMSNGFINSRAWLCSCLFISSCIFVKYADFGS